MTDPKIPPIDYPDVLNELEKLRRICLYSPTGQVKKTPDLREANRALASMVGALKAMEKRARETTENPGHSTDRQADELKRKFLQQAIK
ncbi:MAG: hypothetical protein ACE5G9_11940 [Nitrospinales bacterium]